MALNTENPKLTEVIKTTKTYHPKCNLHICSIISPHMDYTDINYILQQVKTYKYNYIDNTHLEPRHFYDYRHPNSYGTARIVTSIKEALGLETEWKLNNALGLETGWKLNNAQTPSHDGLECHNNIPICLKV